MDLATGLYETPIIHKQRQDQLIMDAERALEEVSGGGFYRPEQETWYSSQLQKSKPE